jgi:hypothetical protein
VTYVRQPHSLVRYAFLLLLALAVCRGHRAHSCRDRIEGAVLYHDPALGLFVQVGDETVQVTGMAGSFSPGDHVSVAGDAAEKDGRRTLSAARVTRLGAGALPAARAVPTAGLATDENTDDWVSFVAVIQEVTPTKTGFDLRVAVDEAQVIVARRQDAPPPTLVDAECRSAACACCCAARRAS